MRKLLCMTALLLSAAQSGVATAACIAAAGGEPNVTVWQNGPGSDAFSGAESVSGGLGIVAARDITVAATSPYGKLKFSAERDTQSLAWLTVDVRLIDSDASQPAISLYLYGADVADAYSSRCDISIGSDWKTIRIALSGLGLSDSQRFEQLRIRNESGGPVRFALNNIAFRSRDDSTPVPPPNPSDSALPSAFRLVDWSRSVGANPVSEANFRTIAIAPPGSGRDASGAINAALQSGNGVVVNLTAGQYALRNPIRITGRNKILRGASRGTTTLKFNGVTGPAIQFGSGYNTGGDFAIVRGVKGERQINMAVAGGSLNALVGKVIEIDKIRSTVSLDQPPYIYTRGGSDRWPGQMNRVLSVSGRTLKLADPLILSYRRGSTRPALRAVTMGAENAGVENVTLRGLNIESLSSGIAAKAVQNIWVRNVISRGMANKSHVELSRVYRCSVQRSVFDDAITHGNGGAGYGTNLNAHTTGCLIEDNIFHRLRHSMIINLGAAGNAFVFNYSEEPVHTSFETGGPGDISLHGNYTSGNLFEGNVVQRVSIADDCCKVERHNTFLRNCLLSGPMTLRFGSNGQNFVGNAMYGTDAALRRTIISGRPALGTGESPLFATDNGRDGIFIYRDNPATRLNELSVDHVEFANYRQGTRWYNGVVGAQPNRIPMTYFYRNNGAIKRSIFNRRPRHILSNPVGNASADCAIPARVRAPRFID